MKKILKILLWILIFIIILPIISTAILKFINLYITHNPIEPLPDFWKNGTLLPNDVLLCPFTRHGYEICFYTNYTKYNKQFYNRFDCKNLHKPLLDFRDERCDRWETKVTCFDNDYSELIPQDYKICTKMERGMISAYIIKPSRCERGLHSSFICKFLKI